MSLTEQEIFDNAWNGLKSQAFEKCINSARSCRYTEGTSHCAIGWSLLTIETIPEVPLYLLPDNCKEILGIESNLCDGWSSHEAFVRSEFCDRLQLAHDTSVSASQVERKLREFAKSNNLAIPNNE